jgi:hypothetical protein
MTNLILTDSLLRWDQMKVQYVVDKDIVRSSSGILRFQTNTSARRVVRARLIATTADERKYLRGIVSSAYYNNDSIEFTLPPEAQKYSGDYTANDLEVAADTNAGSNTTTIRIGSTGTSYPANTALQQGEQISFGNTHHQYTVNAYDETTGQVIFHPLLRTPIVDGDSVNYDDLKFRGFITSANISEELFQGNSDALRMSLIIEEALQ